ncbi:hypothetical protein HYN59_14520 [Flavobacterium album]|uniref:Uncharacterized protein n=1 Tax=Flavobacterium album TaxID=2175091 RepID=A0A2S1R0Z3_9FLAO|nr:T9SS type A sorting domain-containing protein [Flavobacterium album]AWH86249.1 hypothetical protein HYN59_14520 [Flavobacterium album]
MRKKILFLAFFVMSCAPGFAQVAIYPVSNMVQCGNEIFDLTTRTPMVLGDQSPNDYTVTYFSDYLYTNPIANPEVYTMPVGYEHQYIYMKVRNNANNAANEQSFEIGFWGSTPLFQDVYVCESYVLPQVEAGIEYYTGEDGTGTQLLPGDVITETQTIFPYMPNSDCSGTTGTLITIYHNPDIVLEPLIGCETMPYHGAFEFEPYIAVLQINYPDSFFTIHENYTDAQLGANPINELPVYYSLYPMEVLYLAVSNVYASECITVYEILLEIVECSGPEISGHLSFDILENGCDTPGMPAANILVSCVSGNNTTYAYTDDYGNYTFHNVQEGNNNITVNPFNFSGVVITPGTQSVVMGEENIENVNFCLSMPYNRDVAISICPSNTAQPGFPANYGIILSNYGGSEANGVITLQFDDTALDFAGAAFPVIQNGNILTFNYSDLAPCHPEVMFIDFLMAMPGIVDMGDVISFTISATYDGETDTNPDNNIFVLNQIVTNSWDPNDINVREGESITEEQSDDYLHYTIRFQNMGDANAHNVKVLTTLDSNLDWDTFEPIVSSHDFQTNRTGNEVEFRFNNIQLPGAEVNEQESHGYVIYKIKPKATVIVGDSMSAEAGIYFDFNPVVNTNSITTTITDTAGTVDFTANGFVLYPNPASSKVTLQMQNSIANAGVTVTDVLCKTVLKTTVTSTQSDLDVSSLKSGVYFITLTADGKLATQKLVIK